MTPAHLALKLEFPEVCTLAIRLEEGAQILAWVVVTTHYVCPGVLCRSLIPQPILSARVGRIMLNFYPIMHSNMLKILPIIHVYALNYAQNLPIIKKSYYSRIMLIAFFPKLCQHNPPNPISHFLHTVFNVQVSCLSPWSLKNF